VRELQNAIERAVLLGHGSLLMPDHLPKRLLAYGKNARTQTGMTTKGASDMPASKTLEELEQFSLLQALEEHGGNRSETAKALGIARRTLLYKLKALEDAGVVVPPAARRELNETREN
jgi:DNA-binding NtrC family response regulator